MRKLQHLHIGVLVTLLFCATSGWAQTDPEAVRQRVLDALSGQHQPTDLDSAHLASGAWEALAYLEAGADGAPGELYEAVPDYYNYQGAQLILKLVNPINRNEYGSELKVSYRLAEGEVLLLEEKGGAIRQRWRILYLDENYLALDMEGLRVFFTHSPPQE